MLENELENYIKGKYLGSGAYREVFVFALDPKFVVKIAKHGGREVNLLENRIWWEICYQKTLARWFAPVISCSEAGKYLIQKRVDMIPKKEYPKELPGFFTDTKYGNFGLLDNKFVCFDFGCFNVWESIKTNKTRKVKWWE